MLILSLIDGRTFGRIKRLQALMMPIMFKLGVLTTLIFLLVILTAKSVFIGKIILTIQLLTIAVKLATLKIFKGVLAHGEFEHQQKDVHLHVHNSGHEHEVYQQPPYHSEYQPYGAYSHSLQHRSDDNILQPTITAVHPKYYIHQEWNPYGRDHIQKYQ